MVKEVLNWICAVGLLLSVGCRGFMTTTHSPTPLRDIKGVLAAHEHELMAMPGVVGVYVGLMADDRTECLKVMLVRPDAVVEHNIPHTLEGHPMVTEVTGELRPFMPR